MKCLCAGCGHCRPECCAGGRPGGDGDCGQGERTNIFSLFFKRTNIERHTGHVISLIGEVATHTCSKCGVCEWAVRVPRVAYKYDGRTLYSVMSFTLSRCTVHLPTTTNVHSPNLTCAHIQPPTVSTRMPTRTSMHTCTNTYTNTNTCTHTHAHTHRMLASTVHATYIHMHIHMLCRPPWGTRGACPGGGEETPRTCTCTYTSTYTHTHMLRRPPSSTRGAWSGRRRRRV